jgi:hypothetical protein
VLVFAVLVVEVLVWVAVCPPPFSITLPEVVVARPCSAEALDPFAHPRLPPPPPPPDVAGMPVAAWTLPPLIAAA